jgi:N-acetylglucosaminyldiphosphoundecaprenol N-acetyl-beta-D-mannosaminyltransferase
MARIAASGANLLLVAFGAPAQDLWIDRHRTALAGCGIVVAIGVGGTFDYLAGAVPRAPAAIRRLGFEWLYRLIRQPWRWRRQLVLPLFAALVLRERLRRPDE